MGSSKSYHKVEETLEHSTLKPTDLLISMVEEKERRIEILTEKILKDYNNFKVSNITKKADEGYTKILLKHYKKDNSYGSSDEIMKETLIRLNKKTLYAIKCERFSFSKKKSSRGRYIKHHDYNLYIDWSGISEVYDYGVLVL